MAQVVALRLRSVARVDEPEVPLESELDYPRLMNKVLPLEVRVLGWTPVPEDFNARWELVRQDGGGNRAGGDEGSPRVRKVCVCVCVFWWFM